MARAVMRIRSDWPGASAPTRHRARREPPARVMRQDPSPLLTDRIRKRPPDNVSRTTAGRKIALPRLRTRIVNRTCCPTVTALGLAVFLTAALATGRVDAARHRGSDAVALATRTWLPNLTVHVIARESLMPRTVNAASTNPGEKASGCPRPARPGLSALFAPIGMVTTPLFSFRYPNVAS